MNWQSRCVYLGTRSGMFSLTTKHGWHSEIKVFLTDAFQLRCMRSAGMTSNMIMNLNQRSMQSGDAYLIFELKLRYTLTLAQNINAGASDNEKLKATAFRLAEHLAKRRCVIQIEPNSRHDPTINYVDHGQLLLVWRKYLGTKSMRPSGSLT